MRFQLVVTMAAGAACAAGALAANAEREGAPPQPVLVVQNEGLKAWFADERDAAFARGLAMLPQRIAELPHEFDEMTAQQAGLIGLALQLAAQPSYLSLTYNPDNPAGGGFGYGLALSIETAGQRQASELHATVGSLIAMSDAPFEPEPSEQWKGMSTFTVPGAAVVTYGPHQRDDSWGYDLMVGSVDDPAAGLSSLPAAPARGFEPILSARFDARGLEGAVQAAKMFAPPEQQPMVQMVVDQLAEYGFAGESPISVDVQWGRTSDEMLGLTVVHNARAHRDTWYVSEAPLTAKDFRAVPSDATLAWLAKVDWSFVDDAIEDMAGHGMDLREPIEQYRAMTGVDLVEDFLKSFGDTGALYLSESTGGGGLLSGVLLMSVRDNERLATALAGITAHANTMAGGIPERPGALRLSSWTHDGIDLVSLRVPGLPMPLEVTYALVDGWFALAPSPQGAIAAARQALGRGDDGLWANQGFAGSASRDREYISVAFVDGEANAPHGYWVTSLVGSALANAVRSTIDPQRDPGLLVPPYQELVGDVRSEVELTYWDGDDLVTRSTSDRSLLAAATVGIGSFMQFAPAFAIPAIIKGAEEMAMLDEPAVRELAARVGLWAPLTPGQRMGLAALASREALDVPTEAGVR